MVIGISDAELCNCLQHTCRVFSRPEHLNLVERLTWPVSFGDYSPFLSSLSGSQDDVVFASVVLGVGLRFPLRSAAPIVNLFEACPVPSNHDFMVSKQF